MVMLALPKPDSAGAFVAALLCPGLVYKFALLSEIRASLAVLSNENDLSRILARAALV